jgi:hypothetical protein
MGKYTVQLIFRIEDVIECEIEGENEEGIKAEIESNDFLQELGLRMCDAVASEVRSYDPSYAARWGVSDLRPIEPFDSIVTKNPDYEFGVISIDPNEDAESKA